VRGKNWRKISESYRRIRGNGRGTVAHNQQERRNPKRSNSDF
jgi:hypothetical protein